MGHCVYCNAPRPASLTSTPASRQPASPSSAVQRVTVVDVDMKFASMVTFMVKWAFAAIPALIIIFVISFVILLILSAFVGGGFYGLFSHH
jgi:hypothetical protein